jgi:hypothetical protein
VKRRTLLLLDVGTLLAAGASLGAVFTGYSQRHSLAVLALLVAVVLFSASASARHTRRR